MVSPNKKIPGEPDYVPVATTSSSDPVTTSSPNPSDPYSSLSGHIPESGYLSPDANDNLFGRRDSFLHPAPSILSRDSTHASLPGTPTPGMSHRDSWGSGAALATPSEGLSAPSNPRRQSHLAHSSLAWNNTTNDHDDDSEQGYITPAAAAAAAAADPHPGVLSEKPRWAAEDAPRKKSRKWLWIGIGAGTLLVLALLGVGLGLGLTLGRSHGSAGNSSLNGGSSGSGSGSSSVSGSASGTAIGSAPTPTATSGGQGSLLTFEDGSTMTYENPFGGTWYWDPANPFDNSAQANSWTPPLNQSWQWGVDQIYGVNLGGWLVTEPFIVSSLYETYASGPAGTAVDEYTLSQNMGSNLTAAMTEHYETFITERDIAEIASAGLNWVRIPFPHWAVATIDGEPYLERVAWTYFLKAIQWCRKYGIRIELDLHTIPGSQNGWNHSGHLGSINWMNGVMGTANAQRALDIIRTLAQFISQPEYLSVIQMFGFINEPNGLALNKQIVGTFYLEAYKIIREVTGLGIGNGPFLAMHDGFLGLPDWVGFAAGADRMGLDQHPYMCFQNQQVGPASSTETIPCSWWASGTNTSSQVFGVTVSGEWSVAINDCGHWVNNVGAGSRFDGTYAGYTGPNNGTGACTAWNDWTSWSNSTKESLMEVALGSMDALQNWFFWTWKIGNSTTQDPPQVNPFWHYRLGLQNGWIPSDPRVAAGTCVSQGIASNPFDGTFSEPYMTGGAGAGTIAAAQTSSYPWPPISYTGISQAQMTLLPQYTPTATPITMPAPTFTSPGSSATINAGNGWVNPNDAQRQAFAPIAGCVYPPEYSAASLTPTASECGATDANVLKRAYAPRRTSPVV